MDTTITSPVLTPNNARANAKTIQMTERALEKIRAAIVKGSISSEQGGLRLGVEGGGCSGLSYNINFDSELSERDRIYEFDGIRIFIDPKSFIYLHGMILDYEDSLTTQSFNVIDPNSSNTCGCG